MYHCFGSKRFAEFRLIYRRTRTCKEIIKGGKILILQLDAQMIGDLINQQSWASENKENIPPENLVNRFNKFNRKNPINFADNLTCLSNT